MSWRIYPSVIACEGRLIVHLQELNTKTKQKPDKVPYANARTLLIILVAATLAWWSLLRCSQQQFTVVNLISRMTWFLTTILTCYSHHKSQHLKKIQILSSFHPFGRHEWMDALMASAWTKKKVICLGIGVQITILHILNFFVIFEMRLGKIY